MKFKLETVKRNLSIIDPPTKSLHVNSDRDFFFLQVTMFKKIKLFRTSSTKRREEESILKRRRMIQHALLSSYRLVPGVAGGRGCISFECFSKPRFFLCHRDNNLIIERYKDSEDYSK